MIREEDVYRIGRIGKAHGIKGEVTMYVEDDVFDRTDSDYVLLRIDAIPVPFFFEEYRFKTDETVIAKFEGVDTQERARELTGTDVFFPRAQADMSADGEMTYAQLVGYTVLDAATMQPVGEIARIDEQTQNIMFELTDGRLLPASEELIAALTPADHTIALVIPEGLLDL